ncbi:MAG: hypothetical protein GX050_00765 [Firmicutes bacterium]|nr:hypothetical protein [Bacillota bacterium]
MLIIAVVQDQDVNRLLAKLMEKGYSATKLASTGGFLRQGNTTLLIGVEQESAVPEVVAVIKEVCRTRKRVVSPVATGEQALSTYIPTPVEVEVGGATVFTIKVESLEKI